MSGEVISFDEAKASRYIHQALMGFLGDPPDSNFQIGFLNALLVVYQEGLGKGVDDDRIALLRGMAGLA